MELDPDKEVSNGEFNKECLLLSQEEKEDH